MGEVCDEGDAGQEWDFNVGGGGIVPANEVRSQRARRRGLGLASVAECEVVVGDWNVRHPDGTQHSRAAGKRNTAVVRRFAKKAGDWWTL